MEKKNFDWLIPLCIMHYARVLYATAYKNSTTVTIRHKLKPMSQSEYCFRSTYSNGNRNSSKFIYKASFNQFTFIARLWISLLLFPFPFDYVDLKQYPDWLIGLSLCLIVTVVEFLYAVAYKTLA